MKERISFNDKIMTMGSCFSDEIGRRLSETGFDVLRNPFGTIYNPASIARSAERLDSRLTFAGSDVVKTPCDGYTSFSHHSSFNRPDEEEFLSYANESLAKAADFYEKAGWVFLTFGTAWVFRHLERGIIVSNCHKLPASQFRREFLELEQCVALIEKTVSAHPEKNWILTVSPVRHLADGAHGNTSSKSTLMLAIDRILKNRPNVFYFPAYEIVNDELRDYRFYEADMTHITSQAADYIFERFTDFAIDDSCLGRMAANVRENRRLSHRTIVKR
ncbi:MAG: GSCFA domain-containing protein [Bacteroidales bacterium]|nr:GSCFA domain-containing protein [Bacteroidales bacterium]MCI2146243.1 GSCFA domain-containing protein [Bacteroidales bacterium]